MAEGQDEDHEEEWNNANVKNYSLAQVQGGDGPGWDDAPPAAAAPAAASRPRRQGQCGNGGQRGPEGRCRHVRPGSRCSGARDERHDGCQAAGSSRTCRTTTSTTTRPARSARPGIVLLDLIPHYYDTKRVIRIIGEDGTPDSVTINDHAEAIGKVLNDLTVGKYDVVMDTGPGYDTKRLEAQDAMLELVKAFPRSLKVGGGPHHPPVRRPGHE
jgi:hypothetical protein